MFFFIFPTHLYQALEMGAVGERAPPPQKKMGNIFRTIIV